MSGLDCRCGGNTTVTDSRAAPHGIRRRRSCDVCGHRFTTAEVIVGDDGVFVGPKRDDMTRTRFVVERGTDAAARLRRSIVNGLVETLSVASENGDLARMLDDGA